MFTIKFSVVNFKKVNLGESSVMKKFLSVVACVATFAAGAASAGTVLIINGSTGTSEPTTTALITNNLKTLHEEVGNTVTVVSGVPVDLSSFDQVWDIRFSNGLAITSPQEAQFVSFLQGGGGMFVMGENSSFMTRNNSVLSLIAAAGGGSLSYVTPGQTQTVNAPFDMPNAVSTFTYLAAGGVTSPGTGKYITSVGTQGSGVAWGVGDLANAPLGALTVIFDVNFMQGNVGINQQNLVKNLIGFIEVEVNPPAVPVPAALPLALSGLAVLALVRRRV